MKRRSVPRGEESTTALRRCRRVCALAILAVFSGSLVAIGQSGATFSWDQRFFDPSLRQIATLSAKFTGDVPAEASLSLRSPEGAAVRSFPPRKPEPDGTIRWSWDGRNDVGETIAPAAYVPRLEIRTQSGASTIEARGTGTRSFKRIQASYDPFGGLVTYTLPGPSRVTVHVITKAASGAPAVARTLVRDEPRPAGSVLEHWNGFSADGKTTLFEQPGFEVAVDAVALSPDAIIVVVSRGSTPAPKQAQAGSKGSP